MWPTVPGRLRVDWTHLAAVDGRPRFVPSEEPDHVPDLNPDDTTAPTPDETPTGPVVDRDEPGAARPGARGAEPRVQRRDVRRERHHGARGARGGAQAPRHVHRLDRAARPAPPGLRGG
nr:hypothetical protein [Angustibacter aerolatus]